MSKIVLVETISTFRHVYAVRLEDDSPSEWACDDVVMSFGADEPQVHEVGQRHIDESIVSHRDITQDEYIRVFDELNGPIFQDWPDEQKMQYIYQKQDEPVLP